jgi:thioredoxin-dependent peroxiredoxin
MAIRDPNSTPDGDAAMADVRKAATNLKGNPVDLAGRALKPGDKAPDFTLQNPSLAGVSLKDFAGKTLVLWTVPSLDTSVCSTETKTFSDHAKEHGNLAFLCVSMDLPFAQKRWCGAEGVDNVGVASAHQSTKFGEDYGVLIVGGGLDRCLARAVFVIGSDGNLKYADYLNEIASEPDYAKALAAAK